MSFTQQTVQQIAAQRFAKEAAERKAENERLAKEVAAASAALAEAERLSRMRAAQEHEEARLRAERALAEEKVRAEAAALEAAVEEELERLRNRTELEVLRDEVADLKALVGRLTAPSVAMTARPKTYTLCVVANNSNLGGDPDYGTGKVLRISYKLGETSPPVSVEVNEHKTLTLRGQDLRILSASWETARAKADVLSWIIGYINEVA
jgi:hypothetical protein